MELYAITRPSNIFLSTRLRACERKPDWPNSVSLRLSEAEMPKDRKRELNHLEQGSYCSSSRRFSKASERESAKYGGQSRLSVFISANKATRKCKIDEKPRCRILSYCSWFHNGFHSSFLTWTSFALWIGRLGGNSIQDSSVARSFCR